MHTHHNNDTQRARVLVWRALATLSPPPQKNQRLVKKKSAFSDGTAGSE